MSEDQATVEVLVLGGGLMGCALAFHLARRKAGSVVLLERGSLASGATGRSAGLLSYPGWGPWDLRSLRENAEEYANLSDRWGLGKFRRNGGVRVARTPEGERWLDKAAEVLRSEGLEARMLTGEEVHERVLLGDFDDVRTALLSPQDALFDPVEMALAYAFLARRHGVEVHTEAGEVQLQREGSIWKVKAGGRSFAARSVALACGAWTKALLEGLKCPLPLAPFRSQAAAFRPSPLAHEFPSLHDNDLNLYVRPASLGRVLFGDGTEPKEVAPDPPGPAADPEFVERMARTARELFPGRFATSVEGAWTGVCVASPDPYPFVGAVPGTEGLYVATGFNGFGAMRAGALARRLAEGILDGRWEPLAPADPGRFAGMATPFVPVPVFPLGDEGTLHAREPGTPSDAPRVEPVPLPNPEVGFRKLRATSEATALDLPSLSEWFQPFLPLFMEDALRCRGEVEVAEERGEVRGVYVFSPAENTGSIFTRCRSVADHFLALHGRSEVYAEHPFWPKAETMDVMYADLRDWDPRRPLRNPVRLAREEDLPRLEAFAREVQGPVDDAWFRTLPRPEERCFLSEMDGRVVGMSWLSFFEGHGRGHSFVVHPRYRGIGLGTDMLVARMLWLRSHGAMDVVSEIYGGNQASRTAAERAGMAHVGEMYAYRTP